MGFMMGNWSGKRVNGIGGGNGDSGKSRVHVNGDIDRFRKDLTAILAPLKELCPHDLLHQARSRLYGLDYAVWPEQWPSRGEELLALDRASRVPRDSPETRKVEKIVQAFVIRIAEELSKEDIVKYRDGTPGKCTFSDVRPIGSFPLDCKVGDLDEFDYLLVTSDDIASLREYTWDVDKNMYMFDILSAYLYQACLGPVRVEAVYEHGPAVCVELGWECSHGHKHTVGVDMTPARIGNDSDSDSDSFSYSYSDSYSNKLVHPFNTLPTRPSWVVYDGIKWQKTSSLFDKHLMALAADVSENILPAYRLLKLLCTHILLHNYTYEINHPRGYRWSCRVSSHYLKCLLYKHVMAHHKEEEWSVERLPARLAGILEDVRQEKEVCDIITADRIGIIEIPYVVDIKPLISRITQQQLPPSPDPVIMAVECDMVKFKVQCREGRSPSSTEIRCIRSWPHGYSFISMYPSSSLCPGPQPHSSHPLLDWCRDYINRHYGGEDCLDWTYLSDGDANTATRLFAGGGIVRADSVEVVQEKLRRFGELVQRLHDIHPSLNREMFLYNYRPPYSLSPNSHYQDLNDLPEEDLLPSLLFGLGVYNAGEMIDKLSVRGQQDFKGEIVNYRPSVVVPITNRLIKAPSGQSKK